LAPRSQSLLALVDHPSFAEVGERAATRLLTDHQFTGTTVDAIGGPVNARLLERAAVGRCRRLRPLATTMEVCSATALGGAA
jgi:hypothetical protein